MIRSGGVLLPIFSLPGPFGHGVFGEEALAFARQLKESGLRHWLVLPFSPPGGFNSPYQCSSSFAGNPHFIDARELRRRELLTDTELEQLYAPASRVIDYASLIPKHRKALESAFQRLSLKDRTEMEEFAANEPGLRNYALFMTAKERNGGLPWWEWQDEGLKRKDSESIEKFSREEAYLIQYYEYEQFEFDRQWSSLKAQVNELGIRIIGDLPIYPSADSSDFWGNRELFECDEDGYPSRVAGVPPDYFSADGQLWGNPLYRWDCHRERGYDYWLKRIEKNLKWYDLLRLDHFRGFESYWSVPRNAETAREGQWEKGPAMDLFQNILQTFPAGTFIAEDLGEINADVRQFLAETGLPGMKVLQFAFSSDEVDKDRPHAYDRNKVAFTGTHDNDTLLGWARSLRDEEWRRVRDYFLLSENARNEDGPGNELCRRTILTLWQSVADLTIVPVSDLLGLGSDYRVNLPGSVGHNWEIRYSAEELSRIDTAWLRTISRVCQRQ